VGPGAGSDDELDWVPDLPEDMLGAFLDECVERTDGLAERLLVLEQRGAERSLVDEIFRDLHTLKGSSGFAGLKKMNRVAHHAEDLIGQLREGNRTLDRALIDVLLETLDVLRAILERARARKPIDVDVAELLERLKNPATPRAKSPARAERPAEARSPEVAPAAAAPSQATLRIEFDKVDRLLNLVGEIVLARGRLSGASDLQQGVLHEVAQLRKRLGGAESPEELVDELERTERVLRDTFRDFDAGLGGLALAVGQLRDTVMKLRMVPIARLFTKYQRTVRELSHQLGKQVEVELRGAETELDKVLVERLEDPMLHLVRNAVDHGIESPERRRDAGKPPVGKLTLEAGQRGGQIVVRVADDGGGLDAGRLRRKALEKGLIDEQQARELSERESFELIFRAGFSTAEKLSDVSGRGVGMDVVRDAIARLKGSISIDSELGRGTSFELSLPLTLAISQVLTARAAGETVAIPLDAVVSAQTLGSDSLERVASGLCLRQGDELVPAIDLATALGIAGVALSDAADGAAIVVGVGANRAALIVQQVLGRHEVVIKALGPLLSATPCAAGAALIGERMVLVVDLHDVLSRSRGGGAARPLARPRFEARGRVLVAEDSDVIREGIRRELTGAGFEVVVAADGQEALEQAIAQHFDAISTDVMMPRLDGYELTRRLRQLPAYHDVPIVMLTSKDARLDTVRGHDAGADAYLTKPADADELVRTLLGLIARRKKAANPRQS
jgi:two-component system, chemotaxis family, sensor kinase CheA